VWYEEFPGNRTDVTLIKHIVSQTEHYDIEKLSLCLDRGFYSESNIKALLSERFDFIIGLKASTNAEKRLIAESARDITSDAFAIYDNDTRTYCLQVDYPITYDCRNEDNAITSETIMLKVNIYYSWDRKASDANGFNDKITELGTHLSDVNPDKKLQKLIKKYFIKTDNGYQKNFKVINDETKYHGYFLILSSEKT
jgi:transposase